MTSKRVRERVKLVAVLTRSFFLSSCSVTITATCINGCRALLNDTQATSVLAQTDLLITDMSHACGYLVADKLNIPSRVDLSPVGFYGVRVCVCVCWCGCVCVCVSEWVGYGVWVWMDGWMED